MPDTTKENVQNSMGEDVQNIAEEKLSGVTEGNTSNMTEDNTPDVTCLPSKIYDFYQPEMKIPDKISETEEAAAEGSTQTEQPVQEPAVSESAESEALSQPTQVAEDVPKRAPILQTKAAQKTGRFMAALFRKLGRFTATVFRKLGRFMVSLFRKLGVIYCRNICTYSNMILIGAAFLLCITGAFSQAAFGILVLFNLLISIFADRKERKRLERVLQRQDAEVVTAIEIEKTAEKVAVVEEAVAGEEVGVVDGAGAIEGDVEGDEAVGEEDEPDEIFIRQRKSKLERALDAYGRRMGAAAGILSLILFVQAFMFRYESFQGSVISMCSAFVAVMPIGMYLLNHLAGFAGGAKCSKQGLKVQEKRAFMRLSEMDVLCVCDSSLLGESDPAMEMIDSLQNDGVRIVLISAENETEISDKAKAMGVKGDGHPVDASTLHNMEEMRKAVLRHEVIGNATPLQKGIFINILRESKAMVAVAAKDEADCTAVRNADVSIGFAPKGQRVSGLSDMYIENGCLVSIAKAYAESRKLNGNLQHLSSLFFMKNVTALLLALYAVLCSAAYPITLSMWTMISIFTIGIPCVFLLFYGEEKEHRKKFLLDSLKKSLPAAMAGVVAVIVLLRYGIVFDLDAAGTVTAAVMLLAFSGFLMLGRVCLPISAFDIVLLAICAAGFLFCFVFGKPLFGMGTMDLQIRMLLILFLIAEESVYRLFGFLAKISMKKNNEND